VAKTTNTAANVGVLVVHPCIGERFRLELSVRTHTSTNTTNTCKNQAELRALKRALWLALAGKSFCKPLSDLAYRRFQFRFDTKTLWGYKSAPLTTDSIQSKVWNR